MIQESHTELLFLIFLFFLSTFSFVSLLALSLRTFVSSWVESLFSFSWNSVFGGFPRVRSFKAFNRDSSSVKRDQKWGELVQWLEHRNHNPNVVGSTPALATLLSFVDWGPWPRRRGSSLAGAIHIEDSYWNMSCLITRFYFSKKEMILMASQ